MFCSSIQSEQEYKEMVKTISSLSLLILNDVYTGQARFSSLKFSITLDLVVLPVVPCKWTALSY